MIEEQNSSVPDTQPSTNLNSITEKGAAVVSKRVSMREFNRRVRVVVKEKEEKISNMVESKKKVLGKRLSVDSWVVR